MEVRDENGALVSGLANRFAITVDGAAAHPTVAEQSPGIYLADLSTNGLIEGAHQVIAQASDLRNITGQGVTEFRVSSFRLFLPADPALVLVIGK